MKNWIEFGDKAREHLCKGVNAVGDTVKVTMGARGKKVIMERDYSTPVSTNDGVTVARNIELPNAWQNQGCLVVKAAAEKTNDDAGDGTTTVVLLAQSIIREGMRNITSGAKSQEIVLGMEKATECVIETLKKNSKKLRTRLEKEQVATISAGNPKWGKVIVDAMEKVGENGVVTVEEGNGNETTIDTTKGLQF